MLWHRFWSIVVGADIPLDSHIQGGLLIPHANGIVIHPAAEIGPNCLLLQQVTVGNGTKPGSPRLGGHVDVGAGAKILGGIVVGDHAKIGANAVVIDDVPAYATAVGVPGGFSGQRTTYSPSSPRMSSGVQAAVKAAQHSRSPSERIETLGERLLAGVWLIGVATRG